MHLRDVPTRVVSRIAKLLRLAERDDGHEADAARDLAEHLMDKWKIEVDVDFDDDPQASEISFAVTPECVPWRSTLAECLAALHGCSSAVTRHVGEAEGETYYLWMHGDPQPLLRFRLHYRYLETEIERLVSSFLAPPSTRYVRALGAARFIAHLVGEHLREEGAAEPDPEPESEPTETEEAPDGEPKTTALAKIARRPVRAPRDEPAVPERPDDHVLELDLPEDEQSRGVESAHHRSEIARFAVEPPPALDLPIEAVAMGGKRAKKALRDIGIVYVGELVGLTASQLKAINGIGSSTLQMIELDLAFEGLHLRPEDVFPED